MLKKIILIFMLFFSFLPICAEENLTILPSEIGIVKNVEYVDVNDEAIQTKQIVSVKLLTGNDKGEKIELENVLTGNPYYDINIQKNTKLILHAENTDNGVEYSIEDVQRSDNLLILSIIFCSLLLYIGKKKGLYSLISILLTVFIIANFLSPMILAGFNPVIISILACIISASITMYLVGGFNAKSTSATIGAILSLIFAGLLSSIIMITAHLTGFSGESSLFLYSAHPELNFVHITIAAMILATLGAVMDVAMSISSTVNEIFVTDSTKSIRELFKSGMNVGRDIIGTMANTLILVYLGGALPLILLSGNVDLQKFINLNQVVTEIASALIGSIAIVICVPFTALTASVLIHRYGRKIELGRIEL